jgi:hypothetical protein
MATSKKSTVKKSVVVKKSAAPKAQGGKKLTPFKQYLKKYPTTGSAQDTISPLGGSFDYDRSFKKGQREALNKAYSKTYSNYDKDFERFNNDEDGTRRPGMKKGGVVKKKMKNGGSLTGLKASTKRVGPVDAKGAWTKVQEKTLKGAKGKASLTRDKELGATKMKRGGMIKKK